MLSHLRQPHFQDVFQAAILRAVAPVNQKGTTTVMPSDGGETGLARCIALTQDHRGHGASTTAYYLGRVLVSQGMRVLLTDLTGRRKRLPQMRTPVKNLAYWAPPLARPQDVRPALDRARLEVAGKVDVLLLDVDVALLERAGGLTLGLDYVAVLTENTAAGLNTADRVADALGDDLPPHNRCGVVLSRVDAPNSADLPNQTEHRKLPVIGHFPADYLLAAGESYSMTNTLPAVPHDTYLFAVLRIGQALTRLASLHRVSPEVPHVVAPETQNNLA